jgi:hypothetical protein
VSGAYTAHYAYDALGNLEVKTEGGTSHTMQYTDPAHVHAASVVNSKNYRYDANGNLLSGGGRTLAWDAENRLVAATVAEYEEDFDDDEAQGWTASSGTWAVAGGEYVQSNTGNSNTNSYRALTQSGRTIYHWRVRFANGTRAGLHLFASEGASTQRGNSYLVWQNHSVVKIYETVANSLYWRAEFPAPNATGQTHAYQAVYEPDSGQLRVWRDGVYLGGWKDETPLTSGSYLSLRTNITAAGFDDVQVGSASLYTYDGNGALVKKETPFGTTVYVGNHYEHFTPQEAVIGEVGQIDDALTDSPQTVILSRSYANPVVFAQPLSYDGNNPSVVRITEVQADRFTLYVDEAPNMDGSHTTETVSYLVLEAGRWEVAGGVHLEVGTLTTDATVGIPASQWEQVSFENSFTSAPVVLSQVQTENDDHWVKTRQQNISGTSFEVAL